VEALKEEFASEKIDTQDGLRIDWDAPGSTPAQQHRTHSCESSPSTDDGGSAEAN